MRPILGPALVVLALAVAPALAGERVAVLPLRDTGAVEPQLAWIGQDLHLHVGQLLSAQAGVELLPREQAAAAAAAWGPADGPPSPEALRLLTEGGARAALVGDYRAQAGSLHVQARLYEQLGSGAQPLAFAVNGKAGQLTTIASLLAEVAGEALTRRFSRVLQPPLPSPPDFLPARLEPSFGPKPPPEEFAQNETFFLTALKIDPNNADAYAQLGVLYARSGLGEKALANLSTAIELSPKNPRHHWNLGVAHYLKGQLEEALTEFLQATVIDETFVDGFIALGALQRRLGDPQASRDALEKAVKAGPENALALVALGVDAYLAQDYEGARALFEKARGIDPRAAAASVNLALLAWEAGSLDAARKDLERALAAQPADPEALNDMAIIEGARGAHEEAAEKLARALDAGAPRSTTLYNLGTLQLQAGRLAEAEQTFLRVLDAAPDHLASRNNIAFVLLLRGRAAEAVTTLSAVRDDSPASAFASYNLALAHQLERTPQQALVHYLRALKARRDLTPGHVNLGILFEAMGRPEKALTEYLKALSAERTDPEVYTWLGQIYAQRGYGSMAEETIRKTTLVNPDLPLPWHTLATSLEAGDAAKAAAAWRQFLQAVRRDRNRAFWIPVAEQALARLGSPQ